MQCFLKPILTSSQSGKGFTLVELAVVIAIVVILAALGYSKLFNMAGSSEQAIISDFRQQLISGASTYTVRYGTIPNGFDEFVDSAQVIQGRHTISTYNFGTNALDSPCQITPAVITCNGTFSAYPAVEFRWNSGDITINGI